MYRLILAFCLLFSLPVLSASQTEKKEAEATEQMAGVAEAELSKLDKPMYRPLVERYILDELKNVRVDQQNLRAEVSQRIAKSELKASDRALEYTTDTMNIIFYIITAAASILVIVGWNSMRDVKAQIENVVQKKIMGITEDYEARLAVVETRLKERSEEIIANQEQIAKTNQLHSLWMRSGLETSQQSKIDIYDEILAIKPDDVEALSYKADAVLELDEAEWALNLCDKAIAIDDKYGYAYWQRGCAHAVLGNVESAVEDIKRAIEHSPNFIKDINLEPAFDDIRESPLFMELVEKTGSV
ncbi:tetratricopeptide repeat protein [Algicola sagamiensis]|uniref:tetratricopeptide repeat protein n=1 Tax=Algicola sagamiensis TaxID=163869 RepID=UPI00036D6CA2|nr:hypothetical protein [Algicola sagamiensis]